MNILLEFPEIVKSYASHFEHCFSPEGYVHFQRLVSGFLLGSNHTLQGINRMFATDPRNQSSLNRFVNRQHFSLSEINQCRVALMQAETTTAMNEEGCLGIDGTLLHHWGSQFDGIANMWDHVTKSYGPAHELVTLYYADDHTDYPLDYILWQPPDWDLVANQIRQLDRTINEDRWASRHKDRQGWYRYMRDRFNKVEEKFPQLRQSYKTKIHLAEDMLRRHLKCHPQPNLPLAIDSGFSSNRFCRMVSEELGLNYVADIRATQLIYRKGDEKMKLSDFITRLKESHGKPSPDNPKGKPSFVKIGYTYRGVKKASYAYAGVHRFHGFDKKQKIVIHYNNEKLKGEPRITISNRLNWYPSHILRIRRLRWPIETYHQEAKAQGLESYQVRNGKAIDTHIALVVVAYTMLAKAARDEALMAKLRERITQDADVTLPFIRRLLQGTSLWTLAQYIYLNAQKGEPLEELMQPFIDAVAYS